MVTGLPANRARLKNGWDASGVHSPLAKDEDGLQNNREWYISSG